MQGRERPDWGYDLLLPPFHKAQQLHQRRECAPILRGQKDHRPEGCYNSQPETVKLNFGTKLLAIFFFLKKIKLILKYFKNIYVFSLSKRSILFDILRNTIYSKMIHGTMKTS